jgi:hypothetical protein
VSLAALFLYLSTAARDVMTLDTPGFLIASKTLGVAQAPGYPLLTFLGYLFSWVPVGSPAFRIGLLAVVCSTATVALVYATAWRLTESRAAAVTAGLALAFTPLFWRWSLQMETFPLNNLLAALIVYLLVRWHQDPEHRNFLFGAALVFGLGLANQQTVVLLAPAIVWILWLNRASLKRHPGTIGYALLAIVVGLVPYIYVPLAAMSHSPTNWDYVHSFSAFMRLLLRKDYGGSFAQGSGGAVTGGNVLTRTIYLARGLGVIVGAVALLGMVSAYRRLRWYFWFVIFAVFFTGFVFNFATNLDPSNSVDLFILERFFLLPLVIVAPLVGLGICWLAEIITSFRPSLSVYRVTAGAAVAIVVASLIVVGLNYSTLNVSNDHVAGNYSRDVLGGLKYRTILFVNDAADVTTLYMTTVARVRPDVTVLVASALADPWYAQVLRHNHQIHVPARMTILSIIRANPGRPVAVTGPSAPDNSIDGKYYLYPDGLVSLLEPVGHPILASTYESENEAQLARIHVPNYRTIKPDSLEQALLDYYAAIPYRIGQAYALAGNKSEAIRWYRKALAMDPSVSAPVAAIRKLDRN